MIMEKSNEVNSQAGNPPEDTQAPKGTPQQPIESTPDQSLESRFPKKTKKWLIPALIGAVVLSLGIAGFFLYQDFRLKKNQQDDTISKKAENTDNYKVYTNKVYGYSFKYPDSYQFVEELLTESPETSALIMLEYMPFKNDESIGKHKSLVIGHTQGVNKETCETHKDVYSFKKSSSENVTQKEITGLLLGSNIKGIFRQERRKTYSIEGEGYVIDHQVKYPLCVNNKYFEIRFQYKESESLDVENDQFQKLVLESFKLLNPDELEEPIPKDRLSDSEKQLLSLFESNIVPSNQNIQEELENKQITQIFKSGGVYALRTEPKGFIQGLTYTDEDAINIYVVNKNDFIIVEEGAHDITHIANIHPTSINRIIIQLGGGAHVSDLYLIGLDNGLIKIPFTDPKNLLSNSGEVYRSDLIYEDGGTHAESFEIDNKKLFIEDEATSEKFGKYGTREIDLSTGKLINIDVLHYTWD
jgi:hypothetical protein